MDATSIEQAIAELDALHARGSIDSAQYQADKERLIQQLNAIQTADSSTSVPKRVGPAAEASLDLFMTGGPAAPMDSLPSGPQHSPAPVQSAAPEIHGADLFATGGGLPPASPTQEPAQDVQVDAGSTTVAQQDSWIGYLAAHRYRILEELGRGGMGRVFKAEDTQTRTTLAIKTIEAHLLSTDWSEQWIQELKVHARIRHTHIASMHDLEKDPELGFFLTMDFVDGDDLEHYIRNVQASGESVPFAAETSLVFLHELAEALDHAHAQGVIHLDIKPANILLQEASCRATQYDALQKRTFSGSVQLIDFGIAQLRATQTSGHVLGTVYYMPPEQLNNTGSLTAAADIYALGVLTYQLLTGQIFQGGMPGPSALNPELPEAVDAVHAQAVAYQPSERFQSAGAFIRALDSALQQKKKDVPERAPSEPFKSEFSIFGRTYHQNLKLRQKAPQSDTATRTERHWPQIKERMKSKRPTWLETPFVLKAPKALSVSDFPEETFAEWSLSPLAESCIVLDREDRPFMEFCAIPKGSFAMGADARDRGARRPEKPQQQVEMSSLYMARTPVTNEMWHIFLQESRYRPASKHPDYLAHWSLGRPGDAEFLQPVHNISLIDAWAFCDFYGLSLPSEAQWEYAMRGHDKRAYPWGNEEPCPKKPETMFAQVGQLSEKPLPVGVRLQGASPFGVLDAIGSVRQWVADEFHARFLRQVRGTDPVLQGSNMGNFYSLRGSSTMTAGDQAQVYRRHSASPESCQKDIGFRPCFDL